MSKLENISFDDIYIKIMLVLVANEGKIFNQYNLFDSVVNKYDLITVGVPKEFQFKYMLVLRQIMSKSDDVLLYKNNDIYYVSYNKPVELSFDNQIIDPHNSWIDKNEFNEFIINNYEDEIEYVDPENGNTIFHEVLAAQNSNLASKLIDNYYVDYGIKNIYNQTPIELISNLKINNLVLNDLNIRVKINEDINNKTENNIKELEKTIKKLTYVNLVSNIVLFLLVFRFLFY
jgi:hypothetical protein